MVSTRAAVIVLLVFFLVACGTKGGLYLPPSEPKPGQNEPARK